MEDHLPDQTQGVQLATMDEIGQNIQCLSENTLREIAKGPLVKFALNSTDIE